MERNLLTQSIAPRLLPGATQWRIAALCALCILFPASGLAQAAKDDTHIEQSGELPGQGRVVLRSGLAWLDETSHAFQNLSSAFAKELTQRGLTIVSVRPSALEPLPKTPIPNKQTVGAVARPQPVDQAGGAAEGEAAQKASELGKTGSLPKLTLRRYAAPDKDADLSESVRAITAPDVTRALYARSQQAGKPVVQTFSVPGRLPREIETDASIADYVIIIRFAAVQAWAAAPDSPPFGPLEALAFGSLKGSPFGPGILVAASSIGGTGRLGFGAPAQPAPSAPNSYGTPGGYVRGYEGSAPNDFWHRDNDFYQRDYMFKHGPQPNYATPPTGLSSSSPGAQQRGFGVGNLPGRSHVSNIGWHFLVMDGFDLAPVREGKKPVRVWHAAIRTPGDPDELAASLPKMIHAVFRQ